MDMIHRHSPGSTRRLRLGADKGYDAGGFVSDLRQACVTPHVAQKARYSAIDRRGTRHEGYVWSQKHRKKIEEAFGWAKINVGMAQTMYRGVERVRSRFILTMAANNLARLPRLLAARTGKRHLVLASKRRKTSPSADPTPPVRKPFRFGDYFSGLLRDPPVYVRVDVKSLLNLGIQCVIKQLKFLFKLGLGRLRCHA